MNSQSSDETQPPDGENAAKHTKRGRPRKTGFPHKYLKGDWTEEERLRWAEYLDTRKNFELARLASTGMSQEEAQKLVRMAWMTLRPNSNTPVISSLASKSPATSVPVLLVLRHASFVVEEDINWSLLGCSPQNGVIYRLHDEDEKARISRIFDKVFLIEEELGLDHGDLYYLGDVVPDCAEEDVRLADFGYSAHRLRMLLDPGFREHGSREGLKWLKLGLGGKRFWKLLETAIALGESMERRRILDENKAAKALRKMAIAPAGKRAGEVSKAMKRIIEEYQQAERCPPTAKKILTWLRAKRPHSDGDLIEFEHRLWPEFMPKVTWPQFGQLVKDNKNQMDRYH